MTTPAALVTGATGFIGSALVAALVAEGWTVRGAGRRPRPPEMSPEVDYRVVDLAEPGGRDRPGDLDGAVRGVSHVFHLAGASSSLSSVPEMQRANGYATRRLVAALGPGGVQRLVHMSSSSVYGEREQLPVPVVEDVVPRPSRAYGQAKWDAEQAARGAARAGVEVVVLRPVSVFGPGNVKLLASAILDVAIEGYAGWRRLEVPARPVEQRLVHIDDVVGACLHLARHPAAAGRAFNLVAPEYPSSHRIAEMLATEWGMEAERSDDPGCGMDHTRRVQWRARMLAEGMRPDILLTEERFRFMRKANPNNRLSTEALASTGFRFGAGDLAASIGRTVTWYLDNRWVLPRPATV
ncbi:MAG: NAD-dependent epimerase/dehydratase family protein [Acidimicrobiales bacterium]